MPFILETIATTTNADGTAHLVPFGIIAEGKDYVVAPFRPSPTIENLARNPALAVAVPADIRVFAGCVTGRRNWETVRCDKIDGVRLADALSHMELEVAHVADDPIRPRYRCRVVHAANHKPLLGYNRASAAIIEAAILSTRLQFLDAEAVRAELTRLAIAVGKTAGPAEAEAWGWIMAKVDARIGEVAGSSPR